MYVLHACRYVCGTVQDLDYTSESVLGLASTWPQTAAMVPSPNDWFDWEGDRPLNIPLEELVIYELHVRGFTQHTSAHANAPGKPCLLNAASSSHCSMCYFRRPVALLTLSHG